MTPPIKPKLKFWYNLYYVIRYLIGDKTLDGYQKKKYVCKLLFIFLLGHDIDFGQKEAVNLLVSNKYTEKQIVRYFLNRKKKNIEEIERNK